MAKRTVAPTRAAAGRPCGARTQIRVARHDKNWTAVGLGMRIGADPRTVTAIERGSPGVAIGTVFSAGGRYSACHCSADDDDEIARLRRRGEERVALIPSREYQPRSTTGPKADDDLDF